MAEVIDIKAQSEPEDIKSASEPKSRDPVCTPQGIYDEIAPILKKITEARKRPLFSLITHEILSETYDLVAGWRNELKESGKSGELDILINSPGGDLSACYNLARLFSLCSNAWEGLIPDCAASGATLISLGSSKLIMSECAQLGPLDPQVLSKRKERFFQIERQSPLEAFEAVRYLRRFSLESLDATMDFLLQHQVAPHLALSTASEVAIHLVEPILNKIEPYDLGAFGLDSRIAIEYCNRICRPQNQDKQTQRSVDPEILVESYPAHEFIIDIEEARSLGFNVSEPTESVDKAFDELRNLLPRVHEFIGFVS